MPEITQSLVDYIKEHIGQDGIDQFRKIKDVHGRLDAVWMEGAIPHCVHFREGMQIRNLMRTSGLCEGWDDIDLDNHWMSVVEKCIV